MEFFLYFCQCTKTLNIIQIYITNKLILMSNFLTDFKNFAMKGNVLDMAVGVIIGGAFGKIVTSLVFFIA